MPPKRKATGKAKVKVKEAVGAPPSKKAKRDARAPAAAANSATPSIRDMEGRVIRKEFDGVWFDGTVTKVYAKDAQVRVVYSDGDTEDLELAEAHGLLQPLVTSEPVDKAAPVRRVVACGRGRDICAPPIRDAIVALAKQAAEAAGRDAAAPPSLLYLGTPDYESREGLELQTAGFADVGCPVEELQLTHEIPPADEISAAIERADIIAVSGGNTLFAVARWRRLGVDKLLAAAWERGCVMVGGSAGAICWFDGGHSDSLSPASVLNPKPNMTELETSTWRYVRVGGLGLVPALCCPHHDTTQSNGVPRATDFNRMMLENPAEVGVCIDNNCAFVHESQEGGEANWRAVGSGSWAHGESGGLSRKVYENGAVVETQLECDGELKPMSELLALPDFTHLP